MPSFMCKSYYEDIPDDVSCLVRIGGDEAIVSIRGSPGHYQYMSCITASKLVNSPSYNYWRVRLVRVDCGIITLPVDAVDNEVVDVAVCDRSRCGERCEEKARHGEVYCRYTIYSLHLEARKSTTNWQNEIM